MEDLLFENVCHFFHKQILVNGAKSDVCETIRIDIKKSNEHAWIAGDVGNLTESEDFVSEHESNLRIIGILLVISTLQIIVVTAFTSICIKLSKSPLRNEWRIPDIGKKQFVLKQDCKSSLKRLHLD